jgi:hypothetical protein
MATPVSPEERLSTQRTTKVHEAARIMTDRTSAANRKRYRAKRHLFFFVSLRGYLCSPW